MSKHSDLGAMMKQHREAAGLTQSALAELSGVTRDYIASMELGRIQVIYPAVFVKLREVLGFRGWELLEMMGYPTDVPARADRIPLAEPPQRRPNRALITAVGRLSVPQQAALLALVRATVRLAAESPKEEQ